MMFSKVTLWLLAIVIILAILVYKFIQKSYKVDHIPGPLAVPWLGNSLSVLGSLVDIFNTISNINVKYGPVVKIWPMWIRPQIIINDADAVQTLLNSTVYIDKSKEYDLLKPWLGTGLLISTGDKWRQRRKLLTPAFHFNILETFYEVFHKETDPLIENINKHIEQHSLKPLDIYPLINTCALDIICKTAMGTSINSQKENVEFVQAVHTYTKIVTERFFSWKRFDALYFRTWASKRMLKVVSILHNFTNNIISERKRMHQLHKSDFDNEDNNVGYKKKFAFLDLLIKAKLPDESIREEVDTFTFEGHDTITTVLSFTIYEIARHPEIQDKILEELQAVIPKDEPLSYQHLQSLNYLGMVIKEGLRLYPPVPFFIRDIKEPIKLGAYEISSRVTIVVNAFSMHRQEKYFPKPEEFNPERFSAENVTKLHPFCYVPFSAGPRNCIGQKFAMLEMKSIIARLVMNFELLPVPEHKLVLYVATLLKCETGQFIRVEKR